MSRSNPNEHAPNPASRYYEWSGAKGHIRYYDTTAKQNIDVPLPFTFLLLDELATVAGWDNSTDSGIFANMVRDTRVEPLTVKSKKGGIIASGVYKTIKGDVVSAGGHFVGALYVATKEPDGSMSIGLLRLKGAALMAWSNWRRDHRSKLYTDAITITGYTEGKKGSVTYRIPTFETRPVSPETQQRATALDQELQPWLAAYFARKTVDRVEAPAAHDETPVYDETPALARGGHYTDTVADITDDDIPF